MFKEYCKQHKPANPTEIFQRAIMIFMDDLEMKDGVKTFVRVKSNTAMAHFYAHCGEDACKTKKLDGGHVDPVLKLYPGCPVMLTENKDVSNGQANGSRVSLQKVTFKHRETHFPVKFACGNIIQGYFACQVLSLLLLHEVDNIAPWEFEVVAWSFKFKAKLQPDDEVYSLAMKGTQVPIISNGATPGHELQGCTFLAMAVFELHYLQNWIYVILSRVLKLDGLYRAAPLSCNLTKYVMSTEMKDMIAEFENPLAIKMHTQDEYSALLMQDRHNREDRGILQGLNNGGGIHCVNP
jgi:hypothetical protein